MDLNADLLKFLKSAHAKGLLKEETSVSFLLGALDQCFSAYLGVLRQLEVAKQATKPKNVRTGKAHFKPKEQVVPASN